MNAKAKRLHTAWREALLRTEYDDSLSAMREEQEAYGAWTDCAHDLHICYDCGRPAADYVNYCTAHL